MTTEKSKSEVRGVDQERSTTRTEAPAANPVQRFEIGEHDYPIWRSAFAAELERCESTPDLSAGLTPSMARWDNLAPVRSQSLTPADAKTLLAAADYYALESETMFGEMAPALACLRAIVARELAFSGDARMNEHEETRHLTTTPEIASRCKCGEHWSHPGNRSVAEMDSIFQTHVAYAKRMATRVD